MTRYRICRSRRTYAGLALDCLGLTLFAPSPSAAVANARALGMFAGLQLVAIAEEN